jgi:hypothetical protein
MADVEHNYNVALPKIAWPQDTPYKPDGWGRLTPIDTINQQSVRREYFSYTGTFSQLSYNGLTTLLQIPIAKDGDFWCTTFRCYQVDTSDTPADVINTMMAYVTVKDSITGHNFYTPNVNIHFLGQNNVNFVQWIAEPYCFLRGGNIQVGITPVVATSTDKFDIYFSADGWKEYQHAAN